MGCNKDWSLSCVRHYSPSAKKIEVATFYFGRDLDELFRGREQEIIPYLTDFMHRLERKQEAFQAERKRMHYGAYTSSRQACQCP